MPSIESIRTGALPPGGTLSKIAHAIASNGLILLAAILCAALNLALRLERLFRPNTELSGRAENGERKS